jgi:hypothetical protein
LSVASLRENAVYFAQPRYACGGPGYSATRDSPIREATPPTPKNDGLQTYHHN